MTGQVIVAGGATDKGKVGARRRAALFQNNGL